MNTAPLPPLTICMLSNLFPPVLSGSSLQLIDLSRELVKLGHRVIVVTTKLEADQSDYEVADGVIVYRLPAVRLPKMSIALNFPWLNWTFWPANYRRLKNIVEKEKAQLVHIHNHMFDMAFLGALLRWRRRLPTVVTIHTPIQHNNRFYNALLVLAERAFLKFVVKSHVDGVIGADRNIARYVRGRFDRDDTFVVPYGVKTPPTPSDALVAELRAKFGLDGKRVILSVGHLHEIRNRVDLVAALPKIKVRFPAAVIVIVGAVLDNAARDLALALGVGDSVILTGVQDRKTIGGLLRIADVEAHWFTSDGAGIESWPGIATFEAMMAGKVAMTVASEEAYAPGVIADGKTLIIAKRGDPDGIADQIIDVMSDPTRAETIGAAARDVAISNFSWPAIVLRISNYYRTFVRQPSRNERPNNDR